MKSRTFVPRKLDMSAFIESGETLEGALPVTELPRLAASLAQDADASALLQVTWSAQGRQVSQRVGGPQLWLDLSAQGEVAMVCQRCLHAVSLPLSIERSIRFAKDEATAAELDADSDDDVLALSRQFDLIELVEDELIMDLPIVPLHEKCPTDVEAVMNDQGEVAPPGLKGVKGVKGDKAENGVQEDSPDESTPSGKPNPFAVLASLKKTAPEQN